MSKKIYISNLGMIVTNKCNLNCKHCLRGCKNDKDMSKEVIDATLEQLISIGNLCICGGEPTLGVDVLEYLFDSINKNEIFINEVSCVINGTIYSTKFLELLKKIDEYVSIFKKHKVSFHISEDIYHIEDIIKRDLLPKYNETVNLYKESKYFGGFQNIKYPLFNEGNAKDLDSVLTEPLFVMKNYITYVAKYNLYNKEKGLCNIGPLVTINTDGIITECDASLDNQYSTYNYGNVLTDSIEEVMLEHAEVVSPTKWLRLTKKEMIKKNL